jgi:hypothetical protein
MEEHKSSYKELNVVNIVVQQETTWRISHFWSLCAQMDELFHI